MAEGAGRPGWAYRRDTRTGPAHEDSRPDSKRVTQTPGESDGCATQRDGGHRGTTGRPAEISWRTSLNPRCEPGVYVSDAVLLHDGAYRTHHCFLNYNMQTKLTRELTRIERQAYEGAKDFYHITIPAAIVVGIVANVYIWYYDTARKEVVNENLVETVIEGGIAIISYLFALKYYHLCNAIDTAPISAGDSSLQLQAVSINEEKSQILSGSSKPQRFFCDICKITCEYRTRHCRKCNVCVERYDHHCFWIGNCVGRHNHRQFYLFLGIQTVNNIIVFLLISRLRTSANWQWWFQLAGKLLSLGFCCFTGYLLLYHTMLVSCGITTWEHMRRMKISYLKYLPPGFNPFSKGIVQNWRNFFTEQTRANGSNQHQNWQSQVATFQQAKSIKPGCNIIQNEYYSCC